MSALRASVLRLTALRNILAKERVSATTCQHARNLSISTRCQEEKSFNFHVQDEDDFKKRVIESKTPVVVDFHAEWCGPCKLLGPRIEKAVDEHDGKIMLAKVDVDDLSQIAMKYKVRVVPTVIGVKKGESVEKFEGNIPDDQMAAFMKKLLLD